MKKVDRCKKFQKWIGTMSLVGGVLFILLFSYYSMIESIPDKIWIVKGQEEKFDFRVPMTGVVKSDGLEVFGNQSPMIDKDELQVNLNQSFSLKSAEQGSYSMACRLFGIFQTKEVAVEVVEEKFVVPCGTPVGIYVQTNGILIIGTGTVTGSDGMNYDPASALVKSGDYVKTVNEQVVNTKDELVEKLNQCNGEPVVLGLQRDEEYIKLKIDPIKTGENEYKLGIWVRDDLAGIGTLTFYDNQGNFGALGHPVSDMDTGLKVDMADGILYEAEVAGIKKGEKGVPGEVSGIITYLDQYKLGTVQENTNVGIYGNLERIPEELQDKETFPTGMKQDVVKGPASIISYLSGERKEYSIEISGMDYNSSNENKGIMFQVTDPELLALTGGIVQGMSGSPILQNGKIIGAVTHVFVQDASKGYGIFIEQMLQH